MANYASFSQTLRHRSLPRMGRGIFHGQRHWRQQSGCSLERGRREDVLPSSGPASTRQAPGQDTGGSVQYVEVPLRAQAAGNSGTFLFP